MICCSVNRRNVCAKDVVCKELQRKGFYLFLKKSYKDRDLPLFEKVTEKGVSVLFREKEPKSFLIALRSKTLRKSCCVATHNGFLAILTGGSKTYDLLLC